MKEPRIGVIRLNSSITGALITAPNTNEKVKAVKQAFGWINPDYRQSKVDPDGPKNAVPKPEDYIGFPFRFITSTIVGAGSWKATEFSDKVLREALPLFNHKPIYVNHETEVSNNVGISAEAKFTGKKTQNGVSVPGGVDGLIVIDAMTHTDLCRKLNGLPVPHIQSVSIGVIYQWEPSHDFTDSSGETDDWEFERQIGRMVNGKMVRRVVTKILEIVEVSLVDLGADPFAKIRDDEGNLVNIDRSSVVASSAFDDDKLASHYKKTKEMFVMHEGFAKENRVLLAETVLQKSNVKPIVKQLKTTKVMDEIMQYLAAKLGKDVEDITKADVASYLKKNGVPADYDEVVANAEAFKAGKEKIEKYDAAKAKADEFDKVVAVFNPEKKEDFKLDESTAKTIKANAEHGAAIHEANKLEAERLYRLKAGDKVDEALIETIKASNPKQAIALVKEYGGKAAQEFGLQIEGDKIVYRISQEAGDAGAKAKEDVASAFDLSRVGM